MKILITGGKGQLAYSLQQISNGHSFLILNRAEFDITELSKVKIQIDRFNPDIVINTAAFTKVDLAENQFELAYKANRDGAKNLAIVCEEQKCLLVHLSTDYIFDGQKNQPYLETDIPFPLNVYGKSKWEGENFIREYCSRHIILRVSSVFSEYGTNFVKTIVRLAKENSYLTVVDDQISCPTSANDIAETIFKIIENPHFGTYHYCGKEAISWYEFAKRITHNIKNIEIRPISSRGYPAKAKRPTYSVLDCTKILNTYGIKQPHLEISLAAVLNSTVAIRSEPRP